MLCRKNSPGRLATEPSREVCRGKGDNENKRTECQCGANVLLTNELNVLVLTGVDFQLSLVLPPLLTNP